MNKRNYRKPLGEGLLIVFSVLFALFISRVSDNIKIRKQTVEAMDKIQKELTANSDVINRWHENHKKLLNRIDSLVSGQHPELKELILQGDFFGFEHLLNNNSFIDAIVSETAWQAAKSTQIISEFSYEDVEELTQIYALQDIILKQSVPKIVDEIYSRESQNLKNLDATLNQLKLLIQELVGQEEVQLFLYKKYSEEN